MATDVVLDTSAVVAVIKREVGWELVAPRLFRGLMTVVNATEVGDAFSRMGKDVDEHQLIIAQLGVSLLPADAPLALIASRLFPLTRRAGLSLGDRFCLALAKQLNLPALTGDRRWLDVADEVGVKVELFR